jgi:hypothetical protein
VTAEAAAAGRAKVVANLGKGVELGKLAAELRDAALARLHRDRRPGGGVRRGRPGDRGGARALELKQRCSARSTR